MDNSRNYGAGVRELPYSSPRGGSQTLLLKSTTKKSARSPPRFTSSAKLARKNSGGTDSLSIAGWIFRMLGANLSAYARPRVFQYFLEASPPRARLGLAAPIPHLRHANLTPKKRGEVNGSAPPIHRVQDWRSRNKPSQRGA